MAKDIIYKILDVAGIAASKTIEATQDPLGFRCDIYFPIFTNSIYGRSDNEFVYDTVPDEFDRNFLFTGIVTKRNRSDVTWDVYTESETKLFTTLDEVFPDNSKVIVKMKSSNPLITDIRTISFKIDHLESFHSKEFLYHEYILNPMESFEG